MEKILGEISEPEKTGIHPSFSQCLPVFLLPFALFLLLPFGAKRLYLYAFFIWMEVFFYYLIQWFLASINHIILPDRVELITGLFERHSKTIPFDKITEINCKQSLYQRFFKIGDIFIETAGGKDLAI
ncbi:MAG TPA: PH domain-containing protein, partial [bacterium]|nr:PH domain-containing protein [bacterium]